MFVALTISCLALLVGPVLFAAERERPAVLSFLDGFVILSIGAIVLLHVVPEAIHAAGWIAVPVAIVGLALPSFTEKLELQSSQGTHGLAIVLAIVALCLHTFIDGFAIGNHVVSTNLWLLVGIVLHRIPVGMLIWLLIRPVWGTRGAIGSLIVLMIGTAIGAFAATSLPILEGSSTLALFQVFVAGSLLHVLFHQPHDHTHAHDHDGHGAHDHHGHGAHGHHGHGDRERHEHRDAEHHEAAYRESERNSHEASSDIDSDSIGPVGDGATHLTFADLKIPAVLGAIAGLALIYLLGHLESIGAVAAGGHHGHGHASVSNVGGLLTQAATWFAFVSPLYLLGLAFSEMCAQLLIKDMVAPAMKPVLRAIASTTCSCGAVPHYRNATERGDRYAETALFASMLCSGSFLFVALGMLTTPLVMALFLTVAFIAAILARAGSRLLVDSRASSAASPGWSVAQAFATTTPWQRTMERFDRDGPWLLAAAFIAAVILANGLAPVVALSVPVQVLLCFAVALPFYIPGAPATILALGMLAVGISTAACLVFIVAAATLHLRVLLAIRDERGRRAAATWFATIAGGLAACAAIIATLVPFGGRNDALRFWATVSTGDAHGGLHLEMTSLPVALLIACAIASVLTLLGVGRSLLTRGPREWFATMLNGHH